MKKLLIILIAALFISCEKEDIVEETSNAQDHWMVRYRLDCDGGLDQFIHVSNEEFEKGKKRMYWINETCGMYRFKDLSGEVGYYIMPSSSRPCKEH